jgi:hypothetical protein
MSATNLQNFSGDVQIRGTTFIKANTNTNNVAIGTVSGETAQGVNTVAVGVGAGRTSQGTSAVSVGDNAGLTVQGNYSVAIGRVAGQTSQGASATAVGYTAGQTSQGVSATAVGFLAAQNAQGNNSIAIGNQSAKHAQGAGSVAVGTIAGLTSQGVTATAVGYGAGLTVQGAHAVAVGYAAGQSAQGTNAVAVGYAAGLTSQGAQSVAVGLEAGKIVQAANATAVGYQAGLTSQGQNTTAVGYLAGRTSQGAQATALGVDSGKTVQGAQATAVGYLAGQTSQGANAVAVGYLAGQTSQGAKATALGVDSGKSEQAANATAVGYQAGKTSQGTNAVAVGYATGLTKQGTNGTAVGRGAGATSQGASAVAIGAYAGVTGQGANSIILNASGSTFNATTASSFNVKPVRGGNYAASALAYTSGFEIVEETNMHFDTSGNVGIGTPNMAALLHIQNKTSVPLATEGDALGTHILTEYLRFVGLGDAGDINSVSVGFKVGQDDNSNIVPHGRLDICINSNGNGDNAYGVTPNTTVATFLGSGNVGIGTTNPMNTGLHIANSYFASGGNTAHFNPQLFITGDSGTGGNQISAIGFSGNSTADTHQRMVGGAVYYKGGGGTYGLAGYLGIAVANAASSGSDPYGLTEGELVSHTRIAINNDGNVGIGTTPPTSDALELYRNATNGATMKFTSSSGYNTQIGQKSSSTADRSLQFTSNGYAGANAAFKFLTAGASSGYTQALTITGDGRVGIGTVTPNNHLHVQGTIRSTSTINCTLINPQEYGRNRDFRDITFSPSYIGNGRFKVGFDDVGGFVDVLGLNTYTDSSGGGANALMFYKQSILARQYQLTSTSSSAFSTFKTFDMTSPSDDRLKDNEEYIRNATDTLMKLKPQIYDLKLTLTSDVYERAAGVIVQDVWYDTPELRFLVKPGYLSQIPKEAPKRSDDPRDDPDYSKWGEEHAELDYDFFIPYIIKSIQEVVTELPRSKTQVSDIIPSNVDYYRGMLVSADTNEFKNNVPKLSLTKQSLDKKCYGVVSSSNTYSIDNEILIDTKGPGKVWVINHSNIESGDYLTSSNVHGYAMKQEDDVLHNYTVAKTTMDCDFNTRDIIIKRVKQELKDVTYYVKETLSEITKEKYDTIEDVYYKKSQERSIYVKTEYESVDETAIYDKLEYSSINDGTVVSVDEWNVLESNVQSTYTPRYLKEEIKKILTEEYSTLDETEKSEYESTTEIVYYHKYPQDSKNPLPEYTIEEVRQEYVNVLDEHGQIQWEDTDKTETAYNIRYLDANGVITDEANTVHRAAFVGCTYHCG